MKVRIIAIRFDDCYIVSKEVILETVTKANIISAVGKESNFDEYRVIYSDLSEERYFDSFSEKDEEDE